MRGTRPMTADLSPPHQTGQADFLHPAFGAPFFGLLHEVCHHFGLLLACRYSVLCSFRTPVAVSDTVGVVIPCGPSPRSLSASHASAQLPRLRSTPITGASSLLCRTPTPALAELTFSVAEVVSVVEACASREQVSRVTSSTLPDMPSPLTPPEC